MAIISAKHKCLKCGREWTMPVNTQNAELIAKEGAMREDSLPNVCEGCKVSPRGAQGGG